MLRSSASQKKDPEELRELYVQATDDLSYARTFYPNRIVRSFLNGLAQHVFHDLSKEKKFPWARLARFWRDDLPRQMFEARRAMWLSASVFLLAFLIGAVSSRIDPNFPRLILGDSYVDMTLENIRSGDPMKVYKEREALGMSLGIAVNNVFVAFLTWLFGAIWGLGSLFFLLFNGVMVGAFQYFFFEKGVGMESVLTIWIHGTLEISAIVIAGGAGLTMGAGLLFPATLTRAQSFRLAAKRGMKIFVGLVPVFLLAAFFEGFLTRATETPAALRGAFILVNLGFVLVYFVWFPFAKWRRGDFSRDEKEPDLMPEKAEKVSFSAIRSAGELFSESFGLFKKNFGLLGAAIGILAAAGAFLGQKSGAGPKLVFHAAAFLFLGMLAFRCLEKEVENGVWPLRKKIQDAIFLLLPAVASAILFGLAEKKGATGGGMGMLEFAFAPIGILVFSSVAATVFFGPGVWSAAIFFEQKNPISSFFRAFRLSIGQFWLCYRLTFLILAMGGSASLFVNSEVFRRVFELVLWNLAVSGERSAELAELARSAVSTAVLYAFFVLLSMGCGLLFFSVREILEAPALRASVDEIGSGRAIRGLARE